jgi:hypothetical protein
MRMHLPFALAGRPFRTSPLSFKSMCQLSVSPALFFSVNANMALPFLMASLRSVSEDWRASLMASNASEDGKEAVQESVCCLQCAVSAECTVLERHYAARIAARKMRLWISTKDVRCK